MLSSTIPQLCIQLHVRNTPRTQNLDLQVHAAVVTSADLASDLNNIYLDAEKSKAVQETYSPASQNQTGKFFGLKLSRMLPL